MKKFHIKDSTLFIYVVLICFFSSTRFVEIREVVYVSAFVAFIAVLYLVKNRYVAYTLSIALMIGYSIYNISYALFIIPVSLLVLIYKSVASKIRQSSGKKKHHSGTAYMCLNFMILLGVVEGVYSFIRYLKNDHYGFIGDDNAVIIPAVVLMILFVSSTFFKSVKSKSISSFKISSGDYYTLSFINFVAILLFIVTVFLAYAAYQDLQVRISVVCFPWSVWLCVLVYEKNPITESIFNLIEEEIKKVSERRIKEK